MKQRPPAGSYIIDTKWCRQSRTFISVIDLRHPDSDWDIEGATHGVECLEHHIMQPCASRRIAHSWSSYPLEWCDGCMAAYQKG